MYLSILIYAVMLAVAFGVGFIAGRLRDADSKNMKIPYRVQEYEIEDIHLN